MTGPDHDKADFLRAVKDLRKAALAQLPLFESSELRAAYLTTAGEALLAEAVAQLTEEPGISPAMSEGMILLDVNANVRRLVRWRLSKRRPGKAKHAE